MATPGLTAGHVVSIVDSVGDRFPLYADRAGEWRTTRRGSWAAGFWVGLLWLHALRAQSTVDFARAEAWTRRLAGWVHIDTATRGMIFWYGAAMGERLGISAVGGPLARHAAQAMCARFEPEAGVVPWGKAFGDPQPPTRVDSVAGTVALLAWAGYPGVASAHLGTHLRSPDPRPGWTRGQAWLLLGAADGVRWLGEELSERAHALAGHWLDRHGVTVPATMSTMDSPLDTSAAAIAAVALLKLGYTAEGAEILGRLVVEHVVDGRLLDGCYDLANGVATSHELIWGSFFLALGLELLEHPAGGCRDV